MFKSSITSTVSNVATVLVGTAFVTIATIGIVSPAHAKAPVSIERAVEASIDANLRLPTSRIRGVTTLAVSTDGNGRVANVDVVSSSGVKSFDREAVRTATVVHYPATGKARTYAMVLSFNQEPDAAMQARGKTLVQAYLADRRQMLASQTTAQPAG